MNAPAHLTIDYAPRPWQRRFHRRGRRMNVNIWHRRAGKTVAVVNELQREVALCQLPRPHVAYIAPLYGQARRVAWDYVRHFHQPLFRAGLAEPRESELAVRYRNGARFSLFGADNPDALRGMYFDAVAMDEVAQMSPRVWTEVVRPALADRKGRAIFIGTPMGRMNQLHDLYRYATEAGDPEWYGELLTVDDTGAIDDTELAAARREMEEAEFRQEFYCDWSATIRGSFYGDLISDAEREGRIGDVPHDPSLPCVTAWDLGLRDSTVVTTWQVAPDGPRCLSARGWENTALPEVIAMLRTEQPWSYAEHIAPHDIKVRELGSGLSRLEIAQQHGVGFTLAPNWRVAEGIDATRNLLRRARFDAKGCAHLLEALRLYRADYNDKRRTYGQVPVHDWTSDWADSVRMFAVAQASRLAPQLDMWREPEQDLEALERRLNLGSV